MTVTIPTAAIPRLPALIRYLESVQQSDSARRHSLPHDAPATDDTKDTSLLREWSLAQASLEDVFLTVSQRAHFDLAKPVDEEEEVDDVNNNNNDNALPGIHGGGVAVGAGVTASGASVPDAPPSDDTTPLLAGSSRHHRGQSPSQAHQRQGRPSTHGKHRAHDVELEAVVQSSHGGVGDSGAHSDGGDGSVVSHGYRALFRKNLTLLMRQKGMFTCQVATPLLVMGLLVLIQVVVKTQVPGGWDRPVWRLLQQ